MRGLSEVDGSTFFAAAVEYDQARASLLRRPGDPAAARPKEEGYSPMQYALLIYEDESVYRDEDGRAWREIIEAHGAFAGELAEKGLLRGGPGLNTVDTATTEQRFIGRVDDRIHRQGRDVAPPNFDLHASVSCL